MRAKLLEIKQQLRQRMHDPMAQTGKWLQSVVQGYFNYHAVPGNTDSLGIFRDRVTRLWRRAHAPSQPKAPTQLGANAETGGTVASRTARAPSLSPSFALPPFIQDKSRMR